MRYDGDHYVLAGAEMPLDERIVTIVTNRPSISANDVADDIGIRRTEILTRIGFLIANGRLRNAGGANRMKLYVPDHPLALSLP